MPISPFHQGEQQAQSRAGVRDAMEKKGGVVIRNFMPDQHRAFFAGLPYFVLGMADHSGQPWASMMFGAPGFLSSSLPSLLSVRAWPLLHDPIENCLEDGAVVGCLGIELPTRRRNRVNGRVERCIQGSGFSLRVQQSFSNCPKYIQARRVKIETVDQIPQTPRRGDKLNAEAIGLIGGADTFFIASRAAELDGHTSHGLDVSHRGGLPGFMQVLSDRELAFPDYNGNQLFNTVGNILADPRVGLLLVDFPGGAMLHISGHARIDWKAPDALMRDGAERLIFVTIDQVVWREGACPLSFDFIDYSPHLERQAPQMERGGIVPSRPIGATRQR